MRVIWLNRNKRLHGDPNALRWVLVKPRIFKPRMGNLWNVRQQIHINTHQQTMHVKNSFIAICCVALLATGCAATDISEASQSSSPDSTAIADGERISSSDKITPAGSSPAFPKENPSALPLPVSMEKNIDDPSSPEPEALTEEVRARLLEAIATDLSQPQEAISLGAVTAHTWSNGCLGLAAPNEFCTMALVEGWQIEVVNEGKPSVIYRSNERGTVVRRAN